MDKNDIERLKYLADFLSDKNISCSNNAYNDEFNEFTELFSMAFPDIKVTRCSSSMAFQKVKKMKI